MPNAQLKRYEHASSFRRIAAVVWNEPRDPTILGSAEVRADRLVEWIDLKRRETGEKITVTHAVARALAITLRKHPDLNAAVRFGRLYLRQDVDVFLQVAIPRENGSAGEADLSGYCIRKADTKDVGQICNELRANTEKIRNDQDEEFERTKGLTRLLPPWLLGRLLNLIRFMQHHLNIDTSFLGAPADPFGSCMVTSLGMMGVDLAYAPFFPLSNAPMIVLVGAVEEKPVAEDGAVVVRKVLRLNATFDHRIIDGYHGALIAKEIKHLLELPSRLEFADERDHMLGGADSTTDLETLDLDPPTATEEMDQGVDEVV